jgi:DNA repair protein RadC
MKWSLKNILFSPRVQEIAKLDHEISLILYIKKNSITGKEKYDKIGTAEGVELPSIHDVLKGCAINKTRNIILVHNHPYLNGGCDPTPSPQDLEQTIIYNETLKKYGIRLLDHIIVCPEGHFSFKANRLI